jgi:TonB family protein
MQSKCACAVYLLGLALSISFRQQATQPAAGSAPQIVRISRGSSSGMSGAGETFTIEPGFIRWQREPSFDWVEKGVPAEKRTCKITKQDWDGLRNSIDPKTIATFTGIKGCPACVDQPETWAALDFSDGTKKSVLYDWANPPAEIAALLRHIGVVEARCPSQLSMVGGGSKPISTVLYSAKPTKTVEPVYPDSAKAAGSHDTVIVYVVVGRTGEVETVTAVDGPAELRQAAIDAAQQWKWEPHQLNGQPIRFRTKAVVSFSTGAEPADAK